MPEALPPASTTRRGVNPSKFMGSSFAAGNQLEKRVATNERKITILKNILKMRQQSENIGKTLIGIQESVDSIAETTDLQYKQDLKEDERDRLSSERAKANKKEKALETVSSGIMKGAQKVLAPVKNLFDEITKFVVTVLLGMGVVRLLKWFNDPANKGKLAAIGKFLKDWWPALLAGLMAFFPALLGPGGMIIGTVVLLAWGIPKIIAAVKSIFGMNKEVDKVIANNVDGLEKNLQKEDGGISKELDNAGKDLKGTGPLGPMPDTGDPNQVPAEMQGAEKDSPQGFKDGGLVNGPGGVDKVPARLTAGEFVMSKGAVQKYGADTLAGMNAAGKGTNQPIDGAYNGGGLVDLSNTHTSVDNRSVDVRPTQKILPYEGKEYHKKFQFGGKVTGPGGEDKVPAKLTAGEFVMSKSAVKTFGANTFAAMNASGGGTNIPVEKHFAGGGMVTSASSMSKTPPPPPGSKSKVEVIPVPISQGQSSVPGVPEETGSGIPSFSVRAGGGGNKEKTLGIRR